MIGAERKSDSKLTTDTPYLTLTGELWGVLCEDSGEDWPRYNGIALYVWHCPEQHNIEYSTAVTKV